MKKLFILLLIVTLTISLFAVSEKVTDKQLTADNPTFSRGLFCPPGTIFSLHANGFTSASTSDVDPGYILYQNFNMIVPIEGIHFWGINLMYDGGWTGCTENPMNFEIVIYEDSGGLPGTVVCEYSELLLLGIYSGSTFSDFPIYEYYYEFPPYCDLDNGWISIQGNPGGDAECWFMWINSGDPGTNALRFNGSTYSYLDYPLSMCLLGSVTTANDVGITDVP